MQRPASATTRSPTRPNARGTSPGPDMLQERPSTSMGAMTMHEANRAKKKVACNVKSVENRIRFFQREEEKIWRDLEEVRRQAATIEDGRSRNLEKKIADQTISRERDLILQQNRTRVSNQRNATDSIRRAQLEALREKQIAGEERRKEAQEILRQKKMLEAQTKLANSEKAVQIQRAQLEAKLKANQDRALKLERLREEQAAEKMAAEAEVIDAQSRLPELEAQEMLCLQRLQNSRIVTQSVLEELETSLGKRSSVASLLRRKQGEHGLMMEGDVMEEEKDLDDPTALSEDRDQNYPSFTQGQLRTEA